MMCCFDPDSVSATFDTDRQRDVGVYIRPDHVLYVLPLGGEHWFTGSVPNSVNVSDRYRDCDGLTRSPFLDFSGCRPLTNIRPLSNDEVRLFDDTDFCTVEIQYGQGQRIGRLSSGPAIALDGVDYTDTPPVTRPIPPEKVVAARKVIGAIRARQKGLAGTEWPPRWIPSAVYPGYRIGPHGAARLPDTERGRRAAWELEGG